MKKITMLVSDSDKSEFLLKLRQLGIVHIENAASFDMAEKLQDQEQAISDTKKAISVLRQYLPAHSAEKTKCDLRNAHEKAGSVLRIADEAERQQKELTDIENRIEWFKPWGAFDPSDIQLLEKKGVFVRLYRAPLSTVKKVRAIEGAKVVSIGQDGVYFADLNRDPDKQLEYEQVSPPKEGPEQLYRKKKSLEGGIERAYADLKAHARAYDSLKKCLTAMENKRDFMDVMHGMKEEGGFSYLTGFCPAGSARYLAAFSKSMHFGYLIEDPDDPSRTPTLIKNPKWVDIINPVFKFMNTIPGYGEYDISFWFLLFFSLFFAMLIGDAGYGFIFLIATFIARMKLKKAPKEPFFLLYVLSAATVLWGAVTGTWFGLESVAKMPFFKALTIDKISSFAPDTEKFMMYLCFVIGVIHITIAHLIGAFRVINSPMVLSRIGWIMTTWGLFFTANNLVIGKPLPGFTAYMIAVGAALILFFTNVGKGAFKQMLFTLINLPFKIIGSFSDIVSYIRLFAVGYATTIVAKSFNEIALGIGFNTVIAGLCTAIILFLGHSLNIALGVMSVIVHGIRLNMLEFSGQIGMEWSGVEYKPFLEKKTQ